MSPQLFFASSPCSTISFIHSFFFFSFEVSLLPFQSDCWKFPSIITCIYSLICALSCLSRWVFLYVSLRKYTKHITALSAPSQRRVEVMGPGCPFGVFFPDCTSPKLTEQALQATETFLLYLMSLKSWSAACYVSGCLRDRDMVAGPCLIFHRLTGSPTNTGATKPMDQILRCINGLSSAESSWFVPNEDLILNPSVFSTQLSL